MQYRCYKKFNEDFFQLELSESLFSVEISGIDSALNFEAWTTTFMKVYNKHAPIKTKRVKHETQPEWINDEIKTAMKTRDAHYKLKDWKQYKFWRNKIAVLIRTSKRDFFARSIAGDKDTSFLWKHVRNISGKNNEKRIPQEIIIDNESINEKTDIIENLNLFFSKISEKLKSEHPQHNLHNDFGKLSSYVDTKVPRNVEFVIPLMKNTDLLSIIGSLDTTKAAGFDGITAKYLKKSAETVSPSLLTIINISISTGQFPDALKVAKIIPIHKSGQQNEPSNYRPISILSTLSKIIEKHITKHLFAYLNKYSLLHKSQTGFRKHHSCNTVLIHLTDR